MVLKHTSTGLGGVDGYGASPAESTAPEVRKVKYQWFVVARVLHVVAIVVWIGGIATVTTVIFPTMRRIDSNEQKIWIFEQVERNFRPQARIAWVIVGLTGAYMVGSLGAWSRFVEPQYSWMSAMVGLWAIFGLMLFIVEPFIVGPRIRRGLATAPGRALAQMEVLHWVLLGLSLAVIAAVVGGIYGLL
jgi:uncharacterized membrane protein